MVEQTISFPKIFNTVTGKVNLSSGTESINDCLYLLLNSMKNEMLGDPLYGSDVLGLTFEYEGAILEELLRSKILSSIKLYETRITVNEGDINFSYDEHTIIIELRYYVKSEGEYRTFSLAMQNGQTT